MRTGAILGGVAAAGTVGAAVATSVVWRTSPGVRRVNDSIATLTQYWKGVIGSNLRSSESIHLVTLGDSASQGVGGTTAGTGWVPLVGVRLAEAFGRKVEIWNLSVSGAIAQDVLEEQVPQLLELPVEPDLVTVQVGGNDATQAHRVRVASYLDAMDSIMGELPAGSFISDPPWFPLVPMFSARSRRMAEEVRPLIAERGHHLLPMFDTTRRAGLRYFGYTAPDLFHPNDKAYVAFSELTLQAISDAGWTPRAPAEG
ncbi:MAG TPA: SGNH/GDSL hydrolase family protein [Actinomycetaceae bacterium]|nr:SGNH/GDSL hydrolase family protein [Actinomycetaceae bacterium]